MEMTRRGVSHYLSLPIIAACWLASPSPTLAQEPFTNNDGLYNFVTRPEIRAPKLDVRIYDRDAVAPGYWFVAPYNTANAWEDHQGPLYESCQVGPAIYDSDGELIWSGACLFNNMNAFDFRPIDYGGKKYLSLNVGRGQPSIYGAGVILSDTYEVVREVQMSGHTSDFNQHEFSVVDDGAAALYVTERSHEVPAAGIGLGDAAVVWARSNGVAEESLLWGREETLDFEWDCIDRIPLNESTFPWPESPDEAAAGAKGWDYMHMNSVDKFPGGDYLVSMRYSDSLMRVSGSDGSVVWRLGGRASDFEMKDDFVFSRQHHARIVSTNSTHTVVSLLDNASGSLGTDDVTTAPESAALIVRLSHADADATRASWTAEVLRRFPRPDGDYSRLRGSVQILLPPGEEGEGEDPAKTPYPSSLTHIHDRFPGWEATANVLACWSKDGYATEFSASSTSSPSSANGSSDGGNIVAEIRFATNHLDTYRAFKHVGFVGRPAGEPPALKAFAFGDVAGQRSAVVDGSGRGVGQTMTVAYASWNGATEVAAWRAFGQVVRDGGAVVLGQGQGGGTGTETYGEKFGVQVGEEEGGEASSSTTTAPSRSSSSSSSSSSPYSSPSPSPFPPTTEAHHHHQPRSKIPFPPSDPHPTPLTTHLGTFPRSGFETVLTIPNLPVSHLWVEALDASGAVLGRSQTVRVVVPAAQRPYEPVDVLHPDGGEAGTGSGDFVFADESEGLIGLVKVPPQAAAAGAGGGAWGYASVKGGVRVGGEGEGEVWGWLAVVGIGAAVGVGAAAVVLGVWWGWHAWSSWRERRAAGEIGGKGRRRGRGWKGKGKAPAVDKGKYKAVAGDDGDVDGDEEEAMELVETGSEGRSSGGSDEYLGRLDWAPVTFGRGTAGAADAGRGSRFDEGMTLGEVRRGLAQVRRQHQRSASQAEYWNAGATPLVMQAKNKWNEGRSGV